MKIKIYILLSTILFQHSSAILDSNSDCTKNTSYCRRRYSNNDEVTKSVNKVTKVIGLNARGDKQNAVRISIIGDYKTAHCAGAIQNALHIITAAHCLTNIVPSQLLVSAGKHYGSRYEQNRSVISFESHPEWDQNTYLHDIAILKLNESLVLTFGEVSPLELGKQNQINNTVINAWITGWGLANMAVGNLTYPPNSRILSIPLVDYDVCNKIYQKVGKSIHENHLCAGGQKGYGPCTGDGGAPLGFTVLHNRVVSKNFAIGILSTYEGCATDVPGIYTDLEKYKDWILSKTGRQCDYNVHEMDSAKKQYSVFASTSFKPKGKINGNVSMIICAAHHYFVRTGNILGPLKSPLTILASFTQQDSVDHRQDCITWQWNTCVGCQKFVSVKCQAVHKDLFRDKTNRQMSPKIIGGHDTDPHQLPYQVRIFVEKRNAVCHRYAAGGIIYNELYVITSARCITDNIPCEIKVFAGDDIQGTRQVREAVSVIIHEQYVNDEEQNNDIALLKLNRPLNFTTFVHSILLATKEYPTADVTCGEISGWRTDYSEYVLQTATVPIIDSCDCRLYYSDQHHIRFSAYRTCVGMFGQSQCSDDTGNPVTIQENNTKYLYGITSYSRDCGVYPVLATKVSAYQDWIVMRAGCQSLQEIKLLILINIANCLIALLANASLVCATTPSATLSAGGTSVEISGGQCSDFTDLFFDNLGIRVSTQGIWIIYEDINYYGHSVLVENTQMYLNGKFSSIRSAGSSDSCEENTLTLYQGTNFQGIEQYTDRNLSNLYGNALSLIVTGSTPWTLYWTSNFEGDSVCITNAIYNINEIGIP